MFSGLKTKIPRPILYWYHFVLAMAGAVRYGFPSRSMKVIGVTGTDGKTTTVHILHEILAAAGHRVGSLSSARFKIGAGEEPNLLKMTMPGRFRLQRFLAECRRAGCDFAVIEVTSQGILQSRHRFIRFGAATLTNVTPEHIESHGGFERYIAAKAELFRALPKGGVAILNREDASAEFFAGSTRAETVWYGRSGIDVKRVGHPVRVIDVSPRRIRLEIDGQFMEAGIGGEMNVMNALAAAATSLALGASLSAIASAFAGFKGVPGRLEYVQSEPFAVIVDYANTPAAYEKVYRALREEGENKPGSGLICIFGAPGGGRDKWKRPEFGKIASKYCREIILTSDDADDEDPAVIADEIRRGISAGSVSVELDRRVAIRMALSAAGPGDSVIITGMGAQPWLVIGGKKIPWDDRKVAREELASLGYG